MGGRTLGRRMAVALLLLACVWVLIRYRAVLLHQGIDGWGRILAIATPVAGAFWFLVVRRAGIVTFLKRPQPPTPEEIAAARNNLYAALSGAWSDEVSEVYEDEPMRVSFTPWLGSAPTADSPSWAGEFESVAGSFSREPRFRRVVLGDAGSGKSVLVAELQRELIEAPARPDDPLPVIVRAAAWRPDRQALLDWLAEQLSSDYGWLPVTHARALVARGVVLPILDGLDEMPPELRGLAIDRINKHHIYRPLVLTSREEEYRRAISDKDPGVKHCGVVAVKPLRLDDVKGYLDPSGHGNWAEVLQGLDAGDPLARALANPLMLYLARVEYEGRSPENLILLGHEPAIERHLLREFVPAVYQDQPRQPGLRQFRCSAQQARRWLGHLAWPAYETYERNRRQADDAGDPAAPVLAWWQISAAAGPWRRLGVWVRTVALASVIGAMTIWVLEQQGNWRNGRYAGPVDLDTLLLDGPVGRLIRPTVHTVASAFRKEVGTGLNYYFHVIDVVLAHPALVDLAAAGLVVLIASDATIGTSAPVRLQFRPAAMFRQALTQCLTLLAVVVGASAVCLYVARWPVSEAAFFGRRTTWITFGALSLIALTGIPRTFTARSEISGTLTPKDSLRLDRWADATVTITRRSMMTVAVWLFCGPRIATAYVVCAVTATSIAFVVGGEGSFASRSYNAARIWLAVRGHTAWRTMAFLGDAADRGVLRQVGAAYQFRHALLLELLPRWRESPGRIGEWQRELSTLAHRARVPLTFELDQIRDDAARYREEAQSAAQPLPPGFAATLDRLTVRLRKFRDERAQAAIGDLLAAYRTLARTDPETFLPGLIRTLRDLGGRYQWDDALRLATEAVHACSELAETDPETFLPWLAVATAVLAGQLRNLDRKDDALRLTEELAVALRSQAQTSPHTVLPVLGYALNGLASTLQGEDWIRSASVRAESVAVYRRLAAAEPGRFAPQLTSSLTALAVALRELGRRADELTAVREALDACRARAERIAAVRSLLAEEGLAGPTAASRCRLIAESLAPDLLPDFAEAVRGRAVELSAAGRPLRARVLAVEAARIRRLLEDQRARARPLDDMAGLALRLWQLGEHAEALSAAQTCQDLAPRVRDDRLARATERARRVLILARLWWEELSIRWEDNATSLMRRGDRLNALAFTQWVAGRRADARTAAALAVSALTKVVSRARARRTGEAHQKLLTLREAEQALAEAQPAPEGTSSPARSG